jgi:hypothetical protein
MQYPTAGFRVLALASLCYIGASCGTIPDVGLAERCADIMRRAYPSASIDITKREG